MKNYIIVLLGLAFTQTIAAQGGYNPLVEEGKAWHYNLSAIRFDGDIWTWDETYSLEGDTAIGYFLCQKLYYSCSDPYFTDHEYMGAMYELGKKVYYIAPDSTNATLMYDFSCKPGDTVSVRSYGHHTWFDMLIKKKRRVSYLGENLTVIDWSPMGDWGYSGEVEVYENCPGTVWIEGIGSPADFLYSCPTWGYGAGVPSSHLVTCTLDGEVIFDIDDFNANSVPVPMEGKDQRYFTPGTRWTEIRLDTLKHDSWYSRVNGEWVPNFETVEYSVTPNMSPYDVWCSNDDYTLQYKINASVSDGTAQRSFVLHEKHTDDDIRVSVIDHSSSALTYQFNWSIGKELSYQNIIPSHSSAYHSYGTIEEIKEGDFGGVRPLKYVDLGGMRIIQGIGVTEWNDGECLFGPVNLYRYSVHPQTPPERHYRSMLVHFERDGEVLYDVWPEKVTVGLASPSLTFPENGTLIYDLQGRQLLREPQHGIYIKDGKKIAVK